MYRACEVVRPLRHVEYSYVCPLRHNLTKVCMRLSFEAVLRQLMCLQAQNDNLSKRCRVLVCMRVSVRLEAVCIVCEVVRPLRHVEYSYQCTF